MKNVIIMILVVAGMTLQTPHMTYAAQSKEVHEAQIQLLEEIISMLETKLDKLLQEHTTTDLEILSVRESDHTRGSLDAPIVLIEYTDLECPFCKAFHTTLDKVYKKYGASGDVVIVQRHFPLTQLHPNAEKIAVASECIAHLKGNEAYWKFVDSIFTKRKANEGTDMKKVNGYAVAAGVNKTKFTQCIKENTYQDTVGTSVEEGLTLGVMGTPMSFLVMDGQVVEINGAQPFETVDQAIKDMLESLDQ